MNQASAPKPEIVVYTTEPCARCIRAKDLLTARGLSYSEVNLAKDPVGRRELARRTGHMTFPQIIVDGDPIGGFEDLVEADERGELEALAAV
jgi:glutaredoxin 3